MPDAFSPWLAALLFVAVAFLIRLPQLGNPVIQVDDQFYLLVGDRLLHGASLPYVDIWDRKPVGLFLLFAAIRLLGGEGVVQYQLVATLCAGLTAWAIARIGTLAGHARGGLVAGLVYLLYVGVFGGDGGQTPVFYNLLTAAAALAMIRAVRSPGFGRAQVGAGLVVMLLTGLALQIKYTVVFEGLFFGLALLWKAHREGVAIGRLIGLGIAWATLALLPTLLALLAYARLGEAAPFVYANFDSIFARGASPDGKLLARLGLMTAKLLPLLLAAAAGLALPRATAMTPAPVTRFLAGWALAAIAGVLLFGSYYDHYALPLLLPLCAAAAPALANRRSGLAVELDGRRWCLPFAVALPLFGLVLSAATIHRNVKTRGDGHEVRALAAFIKPRLDGCLFVYAGEPILYHLTGSCLPTRWPFPDHLNNRTEDRSIGVDPLAEVERVMATRPKLVVSQDRPESKMNPRTWPWMQATLARDYLPVFSVKVGRRHRIVYQRRPGI